jgi:hypothetical protein
MPRGRDGPHHAIRPAFLSLVAARSRCVPVALVRAAGAEDELSAIGGGHGPWQCAQRTMLKLHAQGVIGPLNRPLLGRAAVAAPELDLGAAGGAVLSVVQALASDRRLDGPGWKSPPAQGIATAPGDLNWCGSRSRVSGGLPMLSPCTGGARHRLCPRSRAVVLLGQVGRRL